jgi:hypothetical protein
MPYHTAADNRGQIHFVSEQVTMLLVGQEVRGQGQPAPRQHRHQSLMAQGPHQAIQGHRGEMVKHRNRLRPIFMTASSLMSFLPLVLSNGAGSELYRGMGAVQLGGLLLSTLVTLVLVPTVFSLWFDLRDKLLSFIERKPPETRMEDVELVHPYGPVQSIGDM